MENDMWLVTFDVEALYTSIAHVDGLEVTQAFLVMNAISSDTINFLMFLLNFALTQNLFIVKESLYRQLQGTVMGAACVPSYANLFLRLWEREIFLIHPVRHN